MTNKTMRDIIESNFEGFKRSPLNINDDELPSYDWPRLDWSEFEDFIKTENLEEIEIDTWICTDTKVGLYAILWNNELVAFTYQSARKNDRIWYFTHGNGEKKLFDAYMKWHNVRSDCRVIPEDDPFYNFPMDVDEEKTKDSPFLQWLLAQ